MTRPRKNPTPAFVVYVTFPNSTKEYAYLCNLPEVKQGSIVVANGTEVIVRRTAASDPIATKYVQSRCSFDLLKRRQHIISQLEEYGKREAQMARFARLKNPEAKRLFRELKTLS